MAGASITLFIDRVIAAQHRAVRFAAGVVLGVTAMHAAIFGTDVPGDGMICGGVSTPCPTGSAPIAMPLSVSLSTSSNAVFNFAALPTFDSPLPPNRLFTGRDLQFPALGQTFTVNLTNASSSFLSAILFFLPTTVDRVSFGVSCTSPIGTVSVPPSVCMPRFETTPAATKGAFTDPSSSSDILRFDSLNLAPGGNATFTFDVTDAGGSTTNGDHPSTSFAMTVTPLLVSAPEPGTLALIGVGLCGLVCVRRLRRCAGPPR
jgi:hypothetical protein